MAPVFTKWQALTCPRCTARSPSTRRQEASATSSCWESLPGSFLQQMPYRCHKFPIIIFDPFRTLDCHVLSIDVTAKNAHCRTHAGGCSLSVFEWRSYFRNVQHLEPGFHAFEGVTPQYHAQFVLKKCKGRNFSSHTATLMRTSPTLEAIYIKPLGVSWTKLPDDK